MKLLTGSKAVKVKWLPTQEADEHCSNEEQKSDSGEFSKQKFLDFTIDLETENDKGIDPSDSQFYVCNESNDSDEENNRKVIDFWYDKYNSSLQEKYESISEIQKMTQELEIQRELYETKVREMEAKHSAELENEIE